MVPPKKRQRRPHCFLPYPEIAEPIAHAQPYEIFDANRIRGLPTNGMADKVRRRIVTPLDQSGIAVARHELGHVRWSPTTLPKVRYDPDVLLAVEDARINMGLRVIALSIELSRGERAHIAHLAALDLERGQFGLLILRAVASLGTNAEAAVFAPLADASPVLRDFAEETREWVRAELVRGRERSGEPVAAFRVARRIARALARRLAAHGLPHAAPRPGGCSGCLLHVGGGGDPPAEGEDGLPGAGGTGSIGDEPAEGECAVPPGVMTIAEPPLTIPVAAAHAAGPRAWRPGREGSVVRYPHRFPIDRAIFRRGTRTRGGSVLIDTSGSMSLDGAKVDRIVSGAPGATLVALYSGAAGAGELRVIVRGGRRAEPRHLEPYASGNIIDLPALEWLARQSAPRIWISDGRVTGVGDVGCRTLRARCERLCRRAGITRVRTVEEAARALARARR